MVNMHADAMRALMQTKHMGRRSVPKNLTVIGLTSASSWRYACDEQVSKGFLPSNSVYNRYVCTHTYICLHLFYTAYDM